jgi:hypothetical protein
MGSMPSMPRNVNQMGPQGSGDRERILAMYRELQSLKDNDESLRQKTINVLKNC